MELLIKNSANHYETGDVIDIRHDGFEWSTGAQMTEHFTILKGVPELTELEQQLLKTPDEQLVVAKSAIKVNALRSAIIKRREMDQIKRRRYTGINGILERK